MQILMLTFLLILSHVELPVHFLSSRICRKTYLVDKAFVEFQRKRFLKEKENKKSKFYPLFD